MSGSWKKPRAVVLRETAPGPKLFLERQRMMTALHYDGAPGADVLRLLLPAFSFVPTFSVGVEESRRVFITAAC